MDFNLNQGFFHMPGRLLFGIGRAAMVGQELQVRGHKKVMIVTEKILVELGVLDCIKHSLEAVGIDYVIFDGILADPPAYVIDQIGAEGIAEKVDALLAVGGGSTMDSAKGAAILITNPGTKILQYRGDYDGTNKFEHYPLPVFALPTTAGTGSEVSTNIAITDTEHQLKVRAQSPHYIPQLIILDANLMTTVPASVAAGCGIDAFTHAFEAYISTNVRYGSWAMCDFMALESIRLISENIRPFVANTGDVKSGQAMLFASTLGGLCLSMSALGIVHGMAKPLGAHFHIPHGMANALMLPHVAKYVVNCNPAKFAEVARVMGVNTAAMTQTQAAKAACTAIEEMCADIGLPGRLRDVGVTEDHFEQMSKDTLTDVGLISEQRDAEGYPLFNNPCKGTRQDLLKIYHNAF